MKSILLSVLVIGLVLSLSGGAALSAPLSGSSKTTPENLPVVKLPKDLSAEHSIITGNPHGTPPGKVKDPKPPEPPEDSAANKWAVIVGIADYEGSGYDLWHADEDAKEMASALQANYGFPKENIKLLLNRKATAAAIESAIDWLVQNENGESSVVFFFSGHGFRASEDPTDPEPWDSDAESDGYDEGIVSHDFYGLTDGWLAAKLSTLESQKIALCFGSCHSGGMFDDDSDLQGDYRVIAAACKADQYAWDYLLLGNTLWGKYFVDEGLLNGLAGTIGEVSIEDAHAYSAPFVVSERPDSQPQLFDGAPDPDEELIP